MEDKNYTLQFKNGLYTFTQGKRKITFDTKTAKAIVLTAILNDQNQLN